MNSTVHKRCVCLLVLAAAPCLAGEGWDRFRGPNGSGVSDAKGLPAEIGPDKNKVWETAVPFGRSSPVLVGDSVVLTATAEGKLVTLALDRATGRELWKSVLDRRHQAELHHDTDSATPTPATDGTNVYAFFHEAGLVSYDGKGRQRWLLELGPFRNFYGIAASPVLAGDSVYVLCDQAEGSFLVAVDKDTGQERWRANRPARLESYSTPVLYPAAGKPRALIVSGTRWVDAYDLATGKIVWSQANVGSGPVSSPVVADDTLFVNAPDHGAEGWPAFDGVLKEHDADGDGVLSREEVVETWLIRHFGWLDTDADGAVSSADWNKLGDVMTNDHWGVYAIRVGAGEADPSVLWNYRKNVAEIASPLVHDGVFYMVQDGILTALDAKTGELLERDRIGEGSPKVYASPVVAEGRIWIGTLEGEMAVLRAGRDWETLGRFELGEEIWATPALADGQLYVRTRGKLYRFGAAAN